MSKLLLSLVVPICGLFLLIGATNQAFAERRVALVIGNGAYQNVAKLDNPPNDANAIAEMFKKAGFDVVTPKKDLGVVDFKRAIRDFTQTSRNADIAVVYYAGHGIEVGGINYLIPVDAKLANDLDAEDEAVEIDRLIRSLEPARRLRLVILDACRDNPFAKKMARTVAMRAITNGLAKVEPTSSDTLIAYAAKAGSTAADGTGQNSPFTTALLNNLTTPGVDIRIALGRVRDEVLKNTGNQQEPFVYGSLGGATTSLVPAPVEIKKIETSAADIRADYELAERVGSLGVWDSFLANHPTGFYAELAKAQRAKLAGGQGAAVAAAPPAPDANMTVAALDRSPAPGKPTPTQPERATPDRLAWEKIQDSNDPAAMRDFIKRFPSSPLSVAAQHRLDLLEQSAADRRQRDDADRRAKAAEADRQKQELAERKRQEAACKSEGDRLARLRKQGAAARDELARFEQQATCERVRSDVVAALQQLPEPAKKPEEPPKAVQPNSPELVRSAQQELRRIGCYAGRDSGSLDTPTRQALEGYLSKRGKPSADIKITDDFVSELKRQTAVESCIATPTPAKPEPVATEKSKPEPVAKEKSKPEPVAKRKEKPEPVATRSKPEPKREASTPRREPPRARAEAAAAPRPAAPRSGGGGATMTGVGF